MGYMSSSVDIVKIDTEGIVSDDYFFELDSSEIKIFMSFDEDKNTNFRNSPENLTIRVKDKNNKYVNLNNVNLKTLFHPFEGSGELEEIPLSFNKEDSTRAIASFIKIVADPESGEEKDIDLLSGREGYLKLEFYSEGLALQSFITVRHGLPDEYLNFRATAVDIMASVGSAGLKFDTDGLQIFNTNNRGGISVIQPEGSYVLATYKESNETYYIWDALINTYNKVNEDDLPSADNWPNNKYYKKIKEQRTVFKANAKGDVSLIGEVTANSGFIGGIEIIDGGLSSDDFTINLTEGIIIKKGKIGGLILEDSVLSDKNGRFTLGNNELKISNAIVENIEAKTIKIGDNCFIASYDRGTLSDFIKVVGEDAKELFSLKPNGILNLGTLKFDGIKSEIQGTNWSIKPEEATFDNITIRGKIKSSIIENGEVQSVGGVILVRPSSFILDAFRRGNEIHLTLQDGKNFYDGDLCKIGGLLDKAITLYKEGTDFYFIENEGDRFNLDNIINSTITSFISSQDGQGATGILINASGNGSIGPQQAISLLDYYEDESNIKYLPKIILGKLEDSDEGGYGLYADNAILHGKITSEQTNDQNIKVTSGINTKSKTLMPTQDNFFKNPGNIILWAGALGDEISKAPFRVDSNGNFYAGSGYFSGSVITDATITAAELKTATITGLGRSGYGLTIQAEQAILFKKTEGNDLFTLNSERMSCEIPVTINQKLEAESIEILSGIKIDKDAIIYKNSMGFREDGSSFSVYNFTHEKPLVSFDGSNNKTSFYNSPDFKTGFTLLNDVNFSIVKNNEEVIGFDIIL